MLCNAFYYLYSYTAYQWGYIEIENTAVTLGEPEMAVTKTQRRTKNNGASERVAEAAEGNRGFRSCLIDHKGADI